MKVVVIGAVVSTKVVVERLMRANVEIAMVFCLDEAISENVSGYCPLHELAEANGIPYKKFRKINDDENVRIMEEIKPDYIFAVGFSQIVGSRIINAAKGGAIGFHPTPLPKFRGRAAMVWQVLLGVRETACTMFFLDEGMDSGDIIAQESYEIGEDDYAEDVGNKLLEAMVPLTDRVIEKLSHTPVDVVKQDESQASYLLKRTPEDGLIDWSRPVCEIHRLVRGVSHPYPGAFGMYDGVHKVTIWRADARENSKYIGIPGQIAYVDQTGFGVVCVDGLLHITDFESEDNVRLLVGHKLK